VVKVNRKSSYRRGYPVALLVGLERDQAVIWEVFSQVVKLNRTIKLSGSRTDDRELYNFHESVLAGLRPALEKGVRSVVVAAPVRRTYATNFLSHVRKHHIYLMQPGSLKAATFAELAGSASQLHSVNDLVRTKEFLEAIGETTSEEGDRIFVELEKCLYDGKNDSTVLFSLKEIENYIFDRQQGNDDSQTQYLILTNEYLNHSKDKKRLQRLLQISNNKKVKVKITDAKTPTGKRIAQLGGAVFFTEHSKKIHKKASNQS
jgi:stalled ribosome rescue protein Dom34